MTLREYSVRELEKQNYWILSDDVGYNIIDLNYKKYINCGIAEQAMVGMAFGMADCGEKVCCYTITPHIVRAWDFIRLYLKKQNIKFYGIGEGNDYSQLGKSHMMPREVMEKLCSAISLPYICATNREDINKALMLKTPLYIQIPNIIL